MLPLGQLKANGKLYAAYIGPLDDRIEKYTRTLGLERKQPAPKTLNEILAEAEEEPPEQEEPPQ